MRERQSRCGHNPARKDVKQMGIKISLAAARVNAGLTQKEAAKACGVSESTIIKWENGTSHPKVSKILLLTAAYDIPLDNIRFD